MPSKLWAVRAALVDLLAEAVDVEVVNGPVARKGAPRRFLLVGTDGGDTGTGERSADGVEARQSWADTAGGREETGEITCAAWAWSGSTDLSAARAEVQAIVDAVEAALLADKKLGGLASGYVELGRMSVWEAQLDAGGVVRASFVVAYTALLS